MASGKVTGAFTATGQSDSFVLNLDNYSDRDFNVALSGTGVATIQLEKSFDGVTWFQIYAANTQLYVWNYNSVNLSETCEGFEQSVQFRLNCTSYTSGTITYRISQ